MPKIAIVPSRFGLTELPPLSLYIHIPWCVKKCPYCDFNSHNLKTELPEQAYVHALIADLEQALPLIWGRRIRTIFIGGGTPSLFSGDAIEQILSAVRRLTQLSPLAEITLEANPGTVDNEHIKDYARAGVNRLSFGVQSFNDKHLQSLGRIHDSECAVKAITLAQEHFTNINIDLIYGLPHQTVEEAGVDLATALSFGVSHLSCYNLTIEPNTAFYFNSPAGLPDNDLCYAMQDALMQQLTSNGYCRYEVSAYAKPGNYCQHNLNYWQFGDYLGIGAGAHSKLSLPDKIIRQVRQKQPQNYMNSVGQSSHIIEDKVINSEDLPFEFALNSLRLMAGFNTSLFVERTGLSLTAILPQLDLAVARGFIHMQGSQVIPTKVGQDFLNDLLMLFLEDKS
jgi:oxygen-independent coproporphyrinogen-3 oxidase